MEKNDQQAEGTNGENGPDKEATLNYIDKVYGTLITTWGAMNRTLLGVGIVSLVLVVMSVGLVSAEESFSLAGVGLRVSLSVFLASGIVIITSLTVYFWSLNLRESQLRNEIRRLYKSIRYEDNIRAMDDELTSPFASMIIAEAIFAPIFSSHQSAHRFILVHHSIVSLGIYSLAPLLPVAAQLTALARLIDIVGWHRF